MGFRIKKWGEKGAPCLGCADRHIGCHGKCERYASFKVQNDKERDIRNDYAKTSDMLDEIRRKRVRYG